MKILSKLVKRKLVFVNFNIGIPFFGLKVLFEFLVFAQFHLDFSSIFDYDMLFYGAIKVMFNYWVNPVVVLEGQWS